jgi:hypothetical protein
MKKKKLEENKEAHYAFVGNIDFNIAGVPLKLTTVPTCFTTLSVVRLFSVKW